MRVTQTDLNTIKLTEQRLWKRLAMLSQKYWPNIRNIHMNKILTFATMIILSLLFAGSANASNMQSPVGFWKTIDDATGQAKSILKISEVNGQLIGRVVKVLAKHEEIKICKA